MFRHSCGICHFANLQRPSDITIGDFWGWERVDPHFNADNKGVSLVLVNTRKGRLFLMRQKRGSTILKQIPNTVYSLICSLLLLFIHRGMLSSVTMPIMVSFISGESMEIWAGNIRRIYISLLLENGLNL